ncbi:MAG: SOS response-associated peptidase [Planctomycetaceae bacterium]|jgi:putative SOS response-associated peptidase YedK|nr:SOS response-associated peptidase [Planctomycetaceae bacterium]
MCGRLTLRLPSQKLQAFFDLMRVENYQPRYNIAPTQDIVAIRQRDEGRVGSMMHWGLIPPWSKDRKLAARMINARAETVSQKPSFRDSFQRQRCLIPADGFYEWKDVGEKYKQPYHITLTDEQPIAMAGLWSEWTDPVSHETIESCTVITTAANSLMRELHERMPVILSRESWDVWLDPNLSEDESSRAALESLLIPFSAAEMQYRPVSRLVSSARNETADCLKAPSERGENRLF